MSSNVAIRWLTAFIDVPERDVETATEFWTGVTGTTTSASRGDRDQFVTLLPSVGDAHLRMQALGERPRVHLDLHVESIDAARAVAERLGATVLADPGHVIMRSPAGIVFCLVDDGGERAVSPAIAVHGPHRVDQLAIDVPHHRFDDEGAFWSALTGWPVRASAGFAEFARLRGSEQMPLCILLQRLGPDDGRDNADLHLDISSGARRREVVEHHRDHGAEVVEDFDEWTVMRDPVGLVYCVTDRPPERPDDPS